MLVLFIALTLGFVPPMNDAGVCVAVLICYALWSGGLALWTRRGGPGPVNAMWLALFVDLAVLGCLTLLTGIAAQQSWTADILSNGLFVIPLLASTQLRPGVCASVVVPTVLVFLAASWATMASNEEPWTSILLSTMALAVLGAGAVVLSRIQRSRVLTIGHLVRDRTALLAELMGLEQRERRALSEQLHDGALQFVLAAKMDLDDLTDSATRKRWIASPTHSPNPRPCSGRPSRSCIPPCSIVSVSLALSATSPDPPGTWRFRRGAPDLGMGRRPSHHG